MVKDIRKTIDEEGVGKARYETYKGVLSRYNSAVADGYYLEAITLIESIIADRLESVANQLFNTNEYSYETLWNLISGVRRLEISSEMTRVVGNINKWRNGRNMALHEMAKFDREDYKKSFQDRYAELEQVAKRGYEIFNNLNNAIKKYRRNLNNNNLNNK